MENQIFNANSKSWKELEQGREKELVGKKFTDTSRLRLFCLKPGETFESHDHDFLQCMYFTMGSGKVTLDDKSMKISPGLTVIVLPNQCHSVKNTGEEDLEILVFESDKLSPQDTPYIDF